MKELSGIALLAAACAWVTPRVVLSHLPPATARWLSVARAELPARAAAAPTPAGIVRPTNLLLVSGNAASPLPDDVRRGREPRARGSRRTWWGGALTQRDGVWVADLRALPSIRTVLAGTQLALPGESSHGDGYQVLHTDRHGLLAAAGIRPGDVLIGVDALPLRTPDDALDAMARLQQARRATFVFRRGGETFRVPVEVLGHLRDREHFP